MGSIIPQASLTGEKSGALRAKARPVFGCFIYILSKSYTLWYKFNHMAEPIVLSMPEQPFDSTGLVIYGGGGQGKVIIDLIRTLGTHRIVGILDDGLDAGEQVLGVPVLGGVKVLPVLYDRGIRLAANTVGGIGKPQVRLQVFQTLAEAGFSCPTLVHPSAWVDSSAELEGGVQILAQSYVSSAARVGYGTLINAGVIVSHDCMIGACVNLSPGAALAGEVKVHDFAQIGMNATVNIGVTIGKGALVGNGATIKADVPPGTRVHAGAIWPSRQP
jgi:sugar O-acyltransferase (sialic acid O-acetyltransferase NeuD family)